MSTHSEKLAQISSNKQANLSGSEKPKQKQTSYKHAMGTNAKVAVEKAMKHAEAIRQQARELLKIKADADLQLAELREELSGFSKLDHRVPLWENKILKAELQLARIDVVAARILDESAEILSDLSHTLATRRIERGQRKTGTRKGAANGGGGMAMEGKHDEH